MNHTIVNVIVGVVLLAVFVSVVLWLNRSRGKYEAAVVLEALNLGYLTGTGGCDSSVDNEESGEEWNRANPGSKFRAKENGKCPRGSVPVDARHGVWKGFCITKKAKKAEDYKKKNPGSIFEKKPGKEWCPKGTVAVPRGGHKGECVNLNKKALRKYKYWGWGGNEGLRCLYNDSTGCNTAWIDGQLVEISDADEARKSADAALRRKYRHWGWGPNEGLLCLHNDNTGCNTHYEGGRLVEGAWRASAEAPNDGKKEDQKEDQKEGQKEGERGYNPREKRPNYGSGKAWADKGFLDRLNTVQDVIDKNSPSVKSTDYIHVWGI
jgi:hypothetical protein